MLLGLNHCRCNGGELPLRGYTHAVLRKTVQKGTEATSLESRVGTLRMLALQADLIPYRIQSLS